MGTVGGVAKCGFGYRASWEVCVQASYLVLDSSQLDCKPFDGIFANIPVLLKDIIGWGNGSVGNSAHNTTMRTRAIIPKTHI